MLMPSWETMGLPPACMLRRWVVTVAKSNMVCKASWVHEVDMRLSHFFFNSKSQPRWVNPNQALYQHLTHQKLSSCKEMWASASPRINSRSGGTSDIFLHSWQLCHIISLPYIFDIILGKDLGKWKQVTWEIKQFIKKMLKITSKDYL